MSRGYVPGSTGVRARLARWRCFYCHRFIWRHYDREAHMCHDCQPF